MAIAVKQNGKGQLYRSHALIVNALLAQKPQIEQTLAAIKNGMPITSGEWQAALNAAAKSGNLDNYNLIVETGKAKPDRETLRCAALGGDLAIFRNVQSQVGFNNCNGSTVLHAAVSGKNKIENRVELVQLLLSGGMDPNEADISGHTPFSLALELNRIDVAVKLATEGKASLRNVERRKLGPLVSALKEHESNPSLAPLLKEANEMMKQV